MKQHFVKHNNIANIISLYRNNVSNNTHNQMLFFLFSPPFFLIWNNCLPMSHQVLQNSFFYVTLAFNTNHLSLVFQYDVPDHIVQPVPEECENTFLCIQKRKMQQIWISYVCSISGNQTRFLLIVLFWCCRLFLFMFFLFLFFSRFLPPPSLSLSFHISLSSFLCPRIE